MITVAFYGNSLVLATIAARVQRRTELQSVTIDAVMPGAFEKLKALQPDVIVLDLGTGQPDPVMALWKTQPEMLLIGVDLGTDRMLILSGQPARALTAEELIEALMTRSEGQLQ